MGGFNLSRWALTHRSVTVFLMLIFVVGGVLSFLNIGRNEDPDFTIRTMVVAAAWPGASVEDTTLQVTERLERTLQEVPNVDYLESYTIAGRTIVFVHLLGSTGAGDVWYTWYEVRKRIGDMAHDLPRGVQGPFFDDDFGDTFGIIYGFTADGFSKRELRHYVENIRSELLFLPDVAQIELLGEQDETIFIEFDTAELAGFGFEPQQLVAALQAQNLVVPAGTLRTGNEESSLRVTGAFESAQDLLDVTFAIGGRTLRLEDIASVRRAFADPPQPLFRVNGEPAIGLAIAMQEGGDILALGENVRQRMAQLAADLPIGIEPILVADQPATVDQAIAEFTESLWQAILIVLAVSFLALGVRAGMVVAFAIPLTLAVVFVLMDLVDIDLQRISLGALIIALALLVDDAMTTVDTMSRRLAAGDDVMTAGSHAYATLAFAMLTGTLVTIAGFVPIGFAQSSAGEYTFSIFAVVGIALIASWFVAVLFAPLIGTSLLRAPKAGTDTQPGFILRGYRAFLSICMKARWLTLPITVAAFVLAVLALALVPRQFFPPSDRVELLVDLTLPHSSSVHATEQVVREIDALLAEEADVAHWSSYVGRGAIRFYLPLDVQLANPFFGQLVLVTKGIEERQRLQPKLEAILEERFPEVTGRVYPLELGPPVGWPIQFRLSGPDEDVLRGLALEFADKVAAAGNVRGLNFDWMAPARELRVRIDQDEVRRLGLSSAAIANVLNTTIAGAVVTELRDDIYLVPVVVRDREGQTLSPTTLRNLQVSVPGGRTVPLSQLAVIEPVQTTPLLWRRDRVPTLTVQADVMPGVLPDTVVDRLRPEVDALRAALPFGYDIAIGGTVEESEYSQASVFAVVPLMLFLMLTFLMFQLKSFQRLIIVLSVVPLGLIGVVLGLLVSGQPLGFVAILGILALVGMIAKNAVILIEQIEQERKAGKTVQDAVLDASSSRLRPILLTALSTVLGMIPIAVTVFWAAMAWAIMGGLLIASLLTLVFLPVLYVTWFGAQTVDRTVEDERAA